LEEKIAYELRVEIRRDTRHVAENFERVAETKSVGRLRIKKRAGTQQVSHAPEATLGHVPQGKGKISAEFCQAVLTPAPPGSKDQLFVSCFRPDWLVALIELPLQVLSSVEAHVTEQPHASIQRAWLLRGLGRRPSPEKGEAKSRAGPRPNVRGVRSTERQTCGHAFE